jgi:hypothetical protein
MNEKTMYVVVRNDLSASYKMVQGAHALAKYAIKHPKRFENWNNGYLIFLAVPTLRALRDLQSTLTENRIKFSLFFEPDIDDQLTSICFYGSGEYVLDLPLA